MTTIKKTRNKLALLLLTLFLIVQIFLPIQMSFDPLRVEMREALATCFYGGSGDWNILNGETCVVANETIIINGNLTINSGGNLTLDNVILKMDCSSDKEFYIHNNGTFNVQNNSLITANDTSYIYELYLRGVNDFEYSTIEYFGGGDANARVFDESYITIDNIIFQNYDTIFSSSDLGVTFKNCYEINISDSLFDNTGDAYAIYTYGTARTPIFSIKDSEFIANADIYVRDFDITYTNCVFDTTSFYSDDVTLTRNWYVDANIADTGSLPIDEATVTIKDQFDSEVGSDTTNQDGSVRFEVAEYTEISTGKNYLTPHTVTAVKTGYAENSTNVNLTDTYSTIVPLTLTQTSMVFSNASTVSDYKRYSDFMGNITIKAPDSSELDSYVFSTNASSSWVSDDSVSISGTSYNASTTKEIPLPKGNEICWKYWAHATDGSESTSNEYCFTVVNTLPVHTTPLLESDWMNFATEDLTAYNQSTFDANDDSVKNIINWYVDDTSIAVLNMPFEGGSSSTSTKDYSGYGNNGTVNGADWNLTTGHDNKGVYEFDGNDNINIGDLDLTTAITIEAWFYTSQNKDYQAIIDKKYNNPGGAFSLYLGDGSINFATAYEDSRIKTTYATSYMDGWHHVAATFSFVEQEQKLYFDGDEVASNTRTVVLDTNDLNLLIGDGVGMINAFTGKIDEVAIYNRALSQQEIQAHFQSRSDLIKSNETQIGEVWKACITPNDGVDDGNKLCSNNITIVEATNPNITFISPTPDDGAITNEGKINVLIDRNVDSCKLKLQEENSIFNVSISSTIYNQWGFKYPVTYIFDIPADSSSIEVSRRDDISESWSQLQEKTSDEFYNGIECVRFDYPNNKAYVSVGFNTTNNIYIKFEDITFVTYNSIAKYYDNRKATYTLSNDNWGAGGASGGEWQGMTNDASDRYQAACHATKMYNLPISIAVNTKKRGTWNNPEPIYGGQQTWDNMQTEFDSCTDNWCWEPVVHTRCHPCSAENYEINGYEWTILGCRDDILANLTNVPFGQYVFEFILPCGYKNDNIRNASAGEFIFLRNWDNGDHPDSTDYTSWNETYQFYGIGGIQTISYDSILGSETPSGRYDESHVNELNDAFDTVYNADGIFYAMWHSDRYLNSVIHSIDSPESGTASTLMQHFAHIANKKDVWYVTNGWLYSYRMVAERAVVTKESEEEKTMSVNNIGAEGFAEYTITTSDGTYNYKVWCDDAHDYVSETDGRNFILDTANPIRTNGFPNSALFAGTTHTTLSLTTNETATCKYSTTANTDYSSMTAFSTTGSETHSTNITGLTNNTNYNYYVKCQDTTGNTNSSDYTISFSVKATAGGGGIPVWMLNQTNQNQNQNNNNTDNNQNNNQDQNTGNNNSDKTIVEQAKQKVFSYGRSRLKSLPQEQDSAKDLKSELEKHYGENKIPVHKKHWHTIVNSYVYGNYPIQAIVQAIKFGGKTVHPTIPFSAWQKAGDYLEWIGR